MLDTDGSVEKSRISNAFDKLLEEIGAEVEFQLPPIWFHKPRHFQFIKRNIYLTKKKTKKRLEDDGIFCSCAPPPGSSDDVKVCDKDCHCGMLLSSCSSGCKCGDKCLNKPFQSRHTKMMKAVETEKCGIGMMADEPIKKGEFIVEYVGEVIDDKTCEERLWNMKHRGETNFYLCEISRDMVIDATRKGNKSRFINHSCSPNTEMQKWIIDGETRIGIFAIRDIKKGEDLTYDYKFVQFGADQVCHCGAKSCKGKLGVKPSKPKSSDAALKLVAYQVYQNGSMHAGTSRKVYSNQQTTSRNCIGRVVKISHRVNGRSYGIIKRFDKYTRKHTIMFEDGVVELLDMSKVEWELIT